ncbi:glycosyltransferase [Microbacterium sp. SSW1-59]|uniref:glycosyltransferase n=1 Tax=Microbacterium xanthum TaxID=3079794 RepID=UPI002AD2B62C|nr:glycosyltransferase [Microbacterium sp. SSW1-59]MDZ8201557.1 glycosyltransferase [Microbacterium sp. SSW1-59]
MTAVLRVMLDQLVSPTDHDLQTATRELTRALIAHAPQGCEVEGIAPAAGGDGAAALSIPGMAGVRRTALARRELAGALQLGVATGIGGGMIHAPSLFAPLVKHDRVHENDQTTVTIWDLRPWDAPDELPRSSAGWHKAMLKRAVKHADAVVVPTHAMARRLGEISPKLSDRIRVISGAAPEGFRVPNDEIGRRRDLGLPEGYVVLSGTAAPSDALTVGFGAVARSGHEVPVVVIDAGDGEEPAIAELAAAAGVPERLVHVRGALDDADRGAVFGAAVAFVSPSARAAFPWRTVEAMTVGVPVVASASDVLREVVVDGGTLVATGEDAAGALGEAVADALGSTAAAERLAVMAADRGRVFSWLEAADKIWALHAEL